LYGERTAEEKTLPKCFSLQSCQQQFGIRPPIGQATHFHVAGQLPVDRENEAAGAANASRVQVWYAGGVLKDWPWRVTMMWTGTGISEAYRWASITDSWRNSSQCNNFQPNVDSNPMAHRVRRKPSGFLPTCSSKTPRFENPAATKACSEAFPIKP